MTIKKSALSLQYNLKIKKMENLKRRLSNVLTVLACIVVLSFIVSGLGLLCFPIALIYALYSNK